MSCFIMHLVVLTSCRSSVSCFSFETFSCFSFDLFSVLDTCAACSGWTTPFCNFADLSSFVGPPSARLDSGFFGVKKSKKASFKTEQAARDHHQRHVRNERVTLGGKGQQQASLAAPPPP
jgi:hypothetical protein